MNTIQKIFFGLTITFFIVVVYSLTIGQNISFEISDWKLRQRFYHFIEMGIPVSILLTLVWTLRKSNSLNRNTTIVLTTLVGFLFSLFLLVFLLFTFGFGSWIDEEVLFKNKEEPEITIRKQVLDVGAFGYGGHRIIKLEPYFRIWNNATIVDTNEIDKTKWEYVFEDKK